MKNQQWLVFLFVLVVMLLTATIVSAQGPKPTPPKPKTNAPTASVGTAFTYQGQLKKNGTPVNGNCYLQFNLYSDAGGSGLVAGPVNGSPNPVNVTNGQVTVQIDFGSTAFQGDARWLQTLVKCGSDSGFTALSLEQVTPTPYAIALMPGASIIGGTTNGLYAESTLSGGNGIVGHADNGTSAYGIWGESASGYGVVGTSADGHGVYGTSPSGVGVQGIQTNSGNYGQLGAWLAGVHGESSGYDGVSGHATTSDKSGVYGVNTGGGYGVYGACSGSGCYGVYSDGNARVTGNLQVDGQAIGFFPRPAYDSGWVSMTANCLYLNHWVGGNVDNYVVDLSMRADSDINNYGYGGFFYGNNQEGEYYDSLTNYQIEICRKLTNVNYMRVRIWVYK